MHASLTDAGTHPHKRSTLNFSAELDDRAVSQILSRQINHGYEPVAIEVPDQMELETVMLMHLDW